MLTRSTPPEQRVLLQNISWQLYESLLGELGNKRSTRIAYHQGQLEIMVPLPEHENRNRLIDRLIVTGGSHICKNTSSGSFLLPSSSFLLAPDS